MNAYGSEIYRQTQVTTVDKGRLIIILYEGAIKFIREAIKAQEAGDIPLKASSINRALDIITELNQSLNMQEGGDIALNLRRIYKFWNDHLLKAKVNRDGQGLSDVEAMMVSLAQAWQVVCQDPEAAKVTPKDPPTRATTAPVRTL
ncbi:MAG: flagellar export chaperone FliS [Deltaproteobacteria bacterium]|jgi:flagellar protein FliS|nr:flagellar export chaperone FliS [Deltaproteobacteria bacterium]